MSTPQTESVSVAEQVVLLHTHQRLHLQELAAGAHLRAGLEDIRARQQAQTREQQDWERQARAAAEAERERLHALNQRVRAMAERAGVDYEGAAPTEVDIWTTTPFADQIASVEERTRRFESAFRALGKAEALDEQYRRWKAARRTHRVRRLLGAGLGLAGILGPILIFFIP